MDQAKAGLDLVTGKKPWGGEQKPGDPGTAENIRNHEQNFDQGNEEAWQDHPVAYGTGAVMGTALPLAIPGPQEAEGATLLARGGRLAATGFAHGGVGGLGMSKADLLSGDYRQTLDAMKDVGIGAGAGLIAAPLVGVGLPAAARGAADAVGWGVGMVGQGLRKLATRVAESPNENAIRSMLQAATWFPPLSPFAGMARGALGVGKSLLLDDRAKVIAQKIANKLLQAEDEVAGKTVVDMAIPQEMGVRSAAAKAALAEQQAAARAQQAATLDAARAAKAADKTIKLRGVPQAVDDARIAAADASAPTMTDLARMGERTLPDASIAPEMGIRAAAARAAAADARAAAKAGQVGDKTVKLRAVPRAVEDAQVSDAAATHDARLVDQVAREEAVRATAVAKAPAVNRLALSLIKEVKAQMIVHGREAGGSFSPEFKLLAPEFRRALQDAGDDGMVEAAAAYRGDLAGEIARAKAGGVVDKVAAWRAINTKAEKAGPVAVAMVRAVMPADVAAGLFPARASPAP